MDKRIAMVGVLVILLVGGVSGGVLEWFGVISGEVVVSGPRFYLDGTIIPIEPHTDNLAYRYLSVNNVPEEENVTHLFNGDRLIYVSEPLGINYFYDSLFNINIRVKTNEKGNLLQLRVIKIDDDMVETEICEPGNPLNISSWYGDFRIRDISCLSNGEIMLNPTDRIALEVRGIGGTAEYWIKTASKSSSTGYSRIEVTAV